MQDRTVNVSTDLLKSWIETGLRSLGLIDDYTIATDITVGDIVKGLAMDNGKWVDRDIVPIRLLMSKDNQESEVEYIKFDG